MPERCQNHRKPHSPAKFGAIPQARPTGNLIGTGGRETTAYAIVRNFTLVDDQCIANNFIFEIHFQTSFFDHICQEFDNVIAQHLTGMIGDFGSDVGRPQNCDSVLVYALVGLAQFAIATAFGS